MKQYILINRVPESYSRTDARAVSDKWNSISDKWKAEEIFVGSFVFPSTGYVISDTERIVSHENALTGEQKVVSVIILKANDYESAVELSKLCPILEQSGSVEVREVMVRS